jgi:membrane fusion protein, multidrug efflux system
MSGDTYMKHLLLIFLTLPLLASVVTEKVEKGRLSQKQSFNGTLSFNEKSRLASETDGKITKLYFDEGDYVKKGALLLEIDSLILDANINATKASIKEVEFALERARLDFKRYEVLLAKQSVSQQKYDEFYFQKMQLEQKLVSLQSSLQAQKILQSKKRLRAPFNGYISERTVQVGEWLKEGSEIALLINPDKVDITIYLPSNYINVVTNDTDLQVTINNKVYPAKLIAALLSGDEKTRSFPLKLRLLPTKDKFFDGAQAQISLEKSSYEDVLMVSRDAVIKRFGNDVVFVIKDEKAQMVPVEIIGFDADKVALSAQQLHEGDEVITKGNERIFPNQEIKR